LSRRDLVPKGLLEGSLAIYCLENRHQKPRPEGAI
jgi:hypothetical protein